MKLDRIVDGNYQTYGGACRCRACLGKTSYGDSWTASKTERAASDAEREEAELWMGYRIEMMPYTKPGESIAAYQTRNGFASKTSKSNSPVVMTGEMLEREQRLRETRAAKLDHHVRGENR